MPPTNSREVKEFFGLVGYFRKFIPHFSDVVRPQTDLKRKVMVLEVF